MCILSVRLLRCGSCRSFYHDRACDELGHGLVWEREQWWASGAVGAVWCGAIWYYAVLCYVMRCEVSRTCKSYLVYCLLQQCECHTCVMHASASKCREEPVQEGSKPETEKVI